MLDPAGRTRAVHRGERALTRSRLARTDTRRGLAWATLPSWEMANPVTRERETIMAIVKTKVKKVTVPAPGAKTLKAGKTP